MQYSVLNSNIKYKYPERLMISIFTYPLYKFQCFRKNAQYIILVLNLSMKCYRSLHNTINLRITLWFGKTKCYRIITNLKRIDKYLYFSVFSNNVNIYMYTVIVCIHYTVTLLFAILHTGISCYEPADSPIP